MTDAEELILRKVVSRVSLGGCLYGDDSDEIVKSLHLKGMLEVKEQAIPEIWTHKSRWSVTPLGISSLQKLDLKRSNQWNRLKTSQQSLMRE